MLCVYRLNGALNGSQPHLHCNSGSALRSFLSASLQFCLYLTSLKDGRQNAHVGLFGYHVVVRCAIKSALFKVIDLPCSSYRTAEMCTLKIILAGRLSTCSSKVKKNPRRIPEGQQTFFCHEPQMTRYRWHHPALQ